MPSYITIIDLTNKVSERIEIDSKKREIYEIDIFDLCIGKQDVLQIISVNGDEYFISKQLVKKYIIKLNTEF